MLGIQINDKAVRGASEAQLNIIIRAMSTFSVMRLIGWQIFMLHLIHCLERDGKFTPDEWQLLK